MWFRTSEADPEQMGFGSAASAQQMGAQGSSPDSPHDPQLAGGGARAAAHNTPSLASHATIT